MEENDELARVTATLSRRIIDYIEAERERGFEALASAIDNPPQNIVIAQPFGIKHDTPAAPSEDTT